MCATIALKLCTWLYIYDLQIKFEDGCYRPIFRRIMPLEGFYSFTDFFSLCLQIFIWYLVYCFAIPRYRSSLRLVLINWFFTKLWPLDLHQKKKNQINSFPHFFSLCLQIFIWYLVLCFAVPRYRLSSSLVFIHLNFTELWPMYLQKCYELSVSCTMVVPYWLCSLR
jgi:hypothetical protein